MERLFGYARDELLGRPVEILVPERYREAYVGHRADYNTQLFSRPMASGAERCACRKDGSEFPAEISLSSLKTGGEILVTNIIRDITERKRAEEERHALEAQVRHKQKLESIGTLAGGVAHEINNPINGIMNYARLIADRLEADSPLTEFAGEIVHETERVATIVRNLLAFARQDKQSHSPARITDIVERTLSLICTVVRRDQITLEVEAPKDILLVLIH